MADQNSMLALIQQLGMGMGGIPQFQPQFNFQQPQYQRMGLWQQLGGGQQMAGAGGMPPYLQQLMTMLGNRGGLLGGGQRPPGASVGLGMPPQPQAPQPMVTQSQSGPSAATQPMGGAPNYGFDTLNSDFWRRDNAAQQQALYEAQKQAMDPSNVDLSKFNLNATPSATKPFSALYAGSPLDLAWNAAGGRDKFLSLPLNERKALKQYFDQQGRANMPEEMRGPVVGW